MPCARHSPLVQDCRDRLIRDLAELLRSTGFRDIRARISGFRSPAITVPADDQSVIRPDLTATTASGTLEIFTVETPETVTCTACNAAWRSLTAYTLTCDAALWVAVPWAVRASTILRLHQLNLRAQVLGL